MINIELLIKYGAVSIKCANEEMLFQEGDKAIFHYQIIDGSIKMNNYNENGDETIQGIFHKEQSFGEPAIFGNFTYPANAISIGNTTLIKLVKDRFLTLLNDHPAISLQLLATLSKRLRFKAIVSKEVKSYNAEHRIMTLLNLFNTDEYKKNPDSFINLTRQAIANLTGLRVETVIRTVKELEKKGSIKILNRKIYL